MSWAETAILWQVYPLGFGGAPIREGVDEGQVQHRLRRLIGWLDHVTSLGCTGLLLGPIFASSSHGYDTIDHYRIDPRLGDDDDFDDLLREAHARGLTVVLDGVFNHVGVQHPAYRQALAGGPEGRLFAWGRDGAATFEGHGGLVELDHRHPDVAGWVSDVMRYWLRRGADGWRLDAAYAIDPGFWRHVLPQVRAEFPEAWVLGEVIHGDYPAIVAASGMDSVTQYELWKATWSSLKDANFFELDWTLRRHNDFLDSFVPQTFVGNHDVTRIASEVGPAKAVLALAVLATVGGTPSIYAGDEYGFEAVKFHGWGGDDAIRPAFPESPLEVTGGDPMLAAHRALLGIRRERPWLTWARTQRTELTNTRMVFDSVGAEGQRLRVVLDVSGEPSVSVHEGDRELFRR